MPRGKRGVFVGLTARSEPVRVDRDLAARVKAMVGAPSGTRTPNPLSPGRDFPPPLAVVLSWPLSWANVCSGVVTVCRVLWVSVADLRGLNRGDCRLDSLRRFGPGYTNGLVAGIATTSFLRLRFSKRRAAITRPKLCVALMVFAMVVIGGFLELFGILLGGRELRDRLVSLRRYESTPSQVSVAVGLAWDVEEARPTRAPLLTTEQRLKRLELLLNEQQERHRRDVRLRYEQLSAQVVERVSVVEKNFSTQLTALRHLVVGTTRGGRRAFLALLALCAGLVLQTIANLCSLS